MNIGKFLRTPFFIERFRLLLFIVHNFALRAATPHHILFDFKYFEKDPLCNFLNIGYIFHKPNFFMIKVSKCIGGIFRKLQLLQMR